MSHSTTTLAGITVPHTKLIQTAIAHVKEVSPPWLFHHVMRSWLFAAKLVAAEDKIDINTETLALAVLLHDLGLVPRYDTTKRRFEVDGASAAVEFLHSHTTDGSSDPKVRLRDVLVWDAIALHTSSSITQDHLAPEVVFAQRGIGIDAMALGIETLPDSEATLKAVVEAFPRLDIKDALRESLCSIAREKPWTTWDNFVAAYGERYVQGYEVNLDGLRGLVDASQNHVLDK